jgi:hypothetical protein
MRIGEGDGEEADDSDPFRRIGNYLGYPDILRHTPFPDSRHLQNFPKLSYILNLEGI